MKHFFTKSLLVATVVVTTITLSSFVAKKAPAKTTASSYEISLLTKAERTTANGPVSGSVWEWTLRNPNPGNGENGTLQDVSHWSLPLSPEAEAALISAEYSFDGITWFSVSLNIDRDPSIKQCTTNDVLKFDIGTSGTNVNYYRITFDKDFIMNPYAKSYIKTGGGRTGCNLYFYSGIGTKLD
jgi:hypothetical protein